MKCLLGASLTFALAAFIPAAHAASLPEVRATASNPVPQCATPGRMTAYLKARNPKLDQRYEDLATHYMRHGEALGIRWDIAFFQMILETGALRYTGDVRPSQNNFAGLGASGRGVRGESFSSVSSGVKAHLQHLMMYAGEHIDDPVADRTRKVQEWGVLTKWQRSIKGPMTYSLVATKWAPSSRNYVRDIAAISDEFYSSYCTSADPYPERLQEARAGTSSNGGGQPAASVNEPKFAAAGAAGASAALKSKGQEIAQRNIEAERNEGGPIKSLGASMLASQYSNAGDASDAESAPAITVLNSDDTAAPAASATAKTNAKTAAIKPSEKSGEIQTAALGGVATQLKPTAPKASASKCKVWTASYGGSRAVIIKAKGKDMVNYTVLDVTEANEKREIDAYIAAYAKGGEKVASFSNQSKALNKAFELCPEG
ncbi:hypothetical protein C6Y62_07410 [Hyphomicrobium sulfonivorans]|nr:glucosaminidase domain-containing protein [Hyphomicrobium sulfonivorans]NSL71635.1 hypothetical protein [Hyphomicrobium sulfonivorans]